VGKGVFWVAGLLTLMAASSAHGSVTVGQIAPVGFTPNTCGPSSGDYIQPTVTSGNSYVMPAAGRISSWSTRAAANAGQTMSLQILRPLGGAVYRLVAHDGPRPLTQSSLNTFTASLAVRAGDVLGVDTSGTTALVSCTYQMPGETIWGSYPTAVINDGDQATFTSGANKRVNATAVLQPSNAFSITGTRRNKKRGKATITVTLPGPGTAVVAGKGVKRRGSVLQTATGGTVKLRVIAKGKAAAKLAHRGRARVILAITFTPTGGDQATQTVKLKLLKKG
jgi:hypothetical protein